MYEQLKAPNLSVVGVPEECLVYVREVFGVAAKYPTAIAGWDEAQYKHNNATPPSDVSVPVWFNWSSFGHVAVSVPGRGFYSTTKEGDKVFGSLSELESFIGCTYLGWSEDVDGVPVVEPASAPTPPTAEYYIVVKGDTLSGIAQKYGITLAKIESLNPQITNPNFITVGERVRVQ